MCPPMARCYTYMMGHFPAPWGNEIRVGLLESITAIAFSVIMLLSIIGGIEQTRRSCL